MNLRDGDPLREGLGLVAAIGLLGINLTIRHRNRLNGPTVAFAAGGFTAAVEQSIGNCPKYIYPRDYGPPFVVSRLCCFRHP